MHIAQITLKKCDTVDEYENIHGQIKDNLGNDKVVTVKKSGDLNHLEIRTKNFIDRIIELLISVLPTLRNSDVHAAITAFIEENGKIGEAWANYKIAEKSPQSTDRAVVDSHYQLGLHYLEKEKNFEKAFTAFQFAAQQNHPAACYQLAEFYVGAREIPIDVDQAFYWYNQAAIRGHAESKYILGKYYLDEHSDAVLPLALAYFRGAADLGHAESQYLMGLHSLDKEDVDQAIKWFQLAAQQGHADAKVQLAQ